MYIIYILYMYRITGGDVEEGEVGEGDGAVGLDAQARLVRRLGGAG